MVEILKFVFLVITILIHNSSPSFISSFRNGQEIIYNLEIRVIFKCCNLSEIFDDTKTLKCISIPEMWKPTFDLEDGILFQDYYKNISYKIGLPSCEKSFILQNKKLVLHNNGDLMVSSNKNSMIQTQIFHPYQYCIDKIRKSNTISNESQTKSTPRTTIMEYDEVALVCQQSEDSEPNPDKWRKTVFAVLMLSSVFCLFLSVLVHIILWDQQKQNIHSWLQFSYTISLLLSFSCLVVVEVWSFDVRQMSQHFCNVMGSLTHFFFLSVFFWLTSMNFDLWLTFGQNSIIKIINKFNTTRTCVRAFVYYNLFSYGVPAIFATTAIILDYIYRNHPNPPVILPKFGQKTCHFYDMESQLPYMYGPLGVLLCLDIGFFFSTISGLRRHYEQTKMATRQSTNTTQDRKRVILFVKLFIVMGFLWVFEFISYISLTFQTGHTVLTKRLFLVTDILNCSKGIGIFIIFICKREIFLKLKDKFIKIQVHLSSIKMVLVTRTSNSSRKALNTFTVGNEL